MWSILNVTVLLAWIEDPLGSNRSCLRDGWLDARGMFMAAAGTGYRLSRKDIRTAEFPPIEIPFFEGEIAVHRYNGLMGQHS